MTENQTHIAIHLHPAYQGEMLKRQELAAKEGKEYVVDKAEAEDLVNTLGAIEVSDEEIAKFKFFEMLKDMTDTEQEAVINHYAQKAGE